ncbi:Global transcription regulator sge1 [Entomophthora muscae]|uniref:Global transcription regulator sge1 n=1 Tax=Entomophthora muscae TaxID=34485 RepID=A0ACC2TE16_9FUNG|nr:Global transcription regulator sge1 [Entomophthora muscae]
MKRYTGIIDTVFDAFLLAELATRGHHPLASIRPSLKEFSRIEAGVVIVFDKTETGMARWIDGKSWSPSRFKGGFFTYTELVNKKPTGLFKKAISVIAPNGHHFQIIGYYTQDMCMITPTLTSMIDRIPGGGQIYDEAEKYRYFKCFRSQSKSWRKPCTYNNRPDNVPSSPENPSSTPFTPMTRHRVLERSHNPISLPPISSLNLSTLIIPTALSPKTAYMFHEDIKQLNLLSSFLSI